MAELTEAAPVLTPRQVDSVAEKINLSSLREIADILPFISRDIISELADVNYHKTGRLSSLDDFAPFIPKEQLKKIAEEEYANRGLHHFESIVPFLDSGYLNELTEKAIKKDGIKAICPIAPFLDKNMKSKYVKENYNI